MAAWDDGVEWEDVDLSDEPTTPPPDPNKPWMWVGGQWVLVATDTSDGVPQSLDLPQHRSAHLRYNPNHGEHGRFAPGDGGDKYSASSGGGAQHNLVGGRLKSSIPGDPGGPPMPRPSLAAASTTKEVEAVTSAGLEKAMGRPVPVDFSGMDPAMARETGEGLLMAAEKFPQNDLASVNTYGPGSNTPAHPEDPTFSSAAFTLVDNLNSNSDAMWITTGPNLSTIRAQYASSAQIGNHAAPSPTGTAVHEMGHVIAAHTSADITGAQMIVDHAVAAGAKNAQDINLHIARNISVYASASPHEALAESFADKMVNGSKASALSKDIYHVINVYYQSRTLP